MNPDLSEIGDLPLPDKLRLVEDLWDQIAASQEPLPVPDWQKEELDPDTVTVYSVFHSAQDPRKWRRRLK